VEERDLADARSGEIGQDGRSEPAGTDHGDPRAGEPALPGLPELREALLAQVALRVLAERLDPVRGHCALAQRDGSAPGRRRAGHSGTTSAVSACAVCAPAPPSTSRSARP